MAITFLNHDLWILRITEVILHFPIRVCQLVFYMVIISFSTHHVYCQEIFKESRLKDTIQPKYDSLKSVIVRPRGFRPKLKGDTIEYNTENIHLSPNAVVEGLLARLPGLHIDMNGNITYNGQRIQQLLVEGEDI